MSDRAVPGSPNNVPDRAEELDIAREGCGPWEWASMSNMDLTLGTSIGKKVTCCERTLSGSCRVLWPQPVTKNRVRTLEDPAIVAHSLTQAGTKMDACPSIISVQEAKSLELSPVSTSPSTTFVLCALLSRKTQSSWYS